MERTKSSGLFIFCTACAVFTLVACGMSIWGKHCNKRSLPSMNVCIPCKELEITLYKDETGKPIFDKLRKTFVGGEKMCCADNAGQMSAMIELVAKKHKSLKYDRPPLSSSKDFVFSPIYAHKLLKYDHNLPLHHDGQLPRFSKPGYPMPLSIDYDNDVRYELSQGVNVLSSGIQITTSALYFVYHSVAMDTQSYPCRLFATQTFMSLLIRHSTTSGESKVLLRSEHTCCPGCVYDRETGYTAGQFNLEKGDILQVEVTSVDLIKFDERSTYVGLVVVGGTRYSTVH